MFKKLLDKLNGKKTAIAHTAIAITREEPVAEAPKPAPKKAVAPSATKAKAPAKPAKKAAPAKKAVAKPAAPKKKPAPKKK